MGRIRVPRTVQVVSGMNAVERNRSSTAVGMNPKCSSDLVLQDADFSSTSPTRTLFHVPWLKSGLSIGVVGALPNKLLIDDCRKMSMGSCDGTPVAC